MIHRLAATAHRCAWLLMLLAASAGSTPRDALPLRVMTFNIEWGGTHVSFDNVVLAIQRARADIVGIQEAEGNLGQIAERLGWHYNLRNYVISRYPLAEPPAAGGRYVLVEVRPDRVVAIVNVHLPSDPYGPDAVRDGATPDEVMALEHATRVPAIGHYLPTLASLIGNDTPVFLTGDFNTPAHTDWVADAVGTRKFLHYAVDWPVTRAVAAAGMRDAWRTVYPDPVARPGLTWWAGRPPLALYAPGENDARDRIDFIWFGGPVNVSSVALIGEQGAADVTTTVMPWPSDHRAVVASFSVVPAPAPDFVTTAQRVYRQGDDIGIVHYFGGDGTADIVVRSAGAGGQIVAERTVEASGRWRIGARTLAPGEYEAAFANGDLGPPDPARFWVQPDGAAPEVSVAGRVFAAGEPVPVSWQNGPGHRNDYIAIYPQGTPAAYDNGLAWTYVEALPQGRMHLDAASAASGWPLPPGTYVARLMKDDGYAVLAESAPFDVE